MRRDVLDATVFLAGPPLLKRQLFLIDRAEVDRRVPLKTAGPQKADLANQRSDHAPRAVLRAVSLKSRGGELDSSVGTAWVGIADGAYRVQPLVSQTELMSHRKAFGVGKVGGRGDRPQVVWAGDGDSDLGGSSGASGRQKTLNRLFGAEVETHFLQSDKDFSDGAFIFEQLRSHLVANFLSGEAISSHRPLVIEVCGATGGRRDHERANFEECLRFVAQCPVPLILLLQPDTVLFNCPLGVEAEEERCSFGLLAHGGDRTGSLNCWGQVAGRTVEVSHAEQAVIHLSGVRYGGAVSFQRPSHGASNMITNHSMELVPLQVGPAHAGLVFELIITGADLC